MSEGTAKLLYKVTLLPILEYNDAIYYLLTQQEQAKLQRLQNAALCTVFRGKTLTIEQMHNEAGVQYLAERRDAHLLALMLDRTKDPQYTEPHVRVTRQTMAPLLAVPKPKTNKLTWAPVYRGSKMWNELPATIRKAISRLDLKNLLKLHNSGRNPDLGRGEVTDLLD